MGLVFVAVDRYNRKAEEEDRERKEVQNPLAHHLPTQPSIPPSAAQQANKYLSSLQLGKRKRRFRSKYHAGDCVSVRCYGKNGKATKRVAEVIASGEDFADISKEL